MVAPATDWQLGMALAAATAGSRGHVSIQFDRDNHAEPFRAVVIADLRLVAWESAASPWDALRLLSERLEEINAAQAAGEAA